MTTAVYRSGTPSLNIPESQNTAPVLEFNCLYTHDIRRKQKRWQDGFLRYHTFNKRVMLYDVPRNFVGDAHWKSAEPLQDGDEVVLEKGGVIVQVAESVGRTETDLTELRARKNQKSSEHGSSPVRPSRPISLQRTGNAPALGLKHRSLNALLGTPKGPIGKAALPTRSPFEERQVSVIDQDENENRPAKRQRVDPPAAWNAVRTARGSAASPNKDVPLWARTADSKKKRKLTVDNKQRTLATKEVIDLCDDEEQPRDRFLPGFSSDALAPSSPPRIESASRAQTKVRQSVRSSSPAFQTQKISREACKAAMGNNVETVHSRTTSTAAQSRSIGDAASPTSNRRRQTAIHGRLDSTNNDQESGKANVNDMTVSRTALSRPGKTLRVAASAPKKKTLLCQDQLKPSSSRTHDAHNEKQTENFGKSKRKVKTQQEQLRERLARIEAKERRDRDVMVLEDVEDLHETAYGHDRPDAARPQPTEPQLGRISPQQQSAMELAELDQMIIQPAQPPSPKEPFPPQDSRQLRRVVSEASIAPSAKPERVPGAPVRYTPSPAKKPPSVEPSESEAAPSRRAPCLPTKARSKNPIQRTVSLNTTSNGTSTVILRKPFQAPKAPAEKHVEPTRAPDPWSREAFDLFTWRPPGFDEENWCMKSDETAATNWGS